MVKMPEVGDVVALQSDRSVHMTVARITGAKVTTNWFTMNGDIREYDFDERMLIVRKS